MLVYFALVSLMGFCDVLLGEVIFLSLQVGDVAFSVPNSLVVTLERVLGNETVGNCEMIFVLWSWIVFLCLFPLQQNANYCIYFALFFFFFTNLQTCEGEPWCASKVVVLWLLGGSLKHLLILFNLLISDGNWNSLKVKIHLIFFFSFD